MVEPRRASARGLCRTASLPHAVGSKQQLDSPFQEIPLTCFLSFGHIGSSSFLVGLLCTSGCMAWALLSELLAKGRRSIFQLPQSHSPDDYQADEKHQEPIPTQYRHHGDR